MIDSVNRLTETQLRALAEVDSPTIANAMETFGRHPRLGHFAGYDIRCHYPELPPSVGYTVTCRGDSTTEGRQMERGLVQLWEALAQTPGPTIVVIQDVGADRLHSCHCGEVMATTMQRLGAVALLTDGGVRDLHEVRALGGFQFFAPGLVVAHGNPLIFDVGVGVTISGMPVKTGDLLHGDANGILTIPHAIAGDIVDAALKVREREAETLRRIRSPDFSPLAGPRQSEH